MKLIALLIICCLSFAITNAQNPTAKKPVTLQSDEQLYEKITREMCRCLNASTNKSNLMDDFGPCAEKGLDKYKPEVINYLDSQGIDTSSESGYQVGRLIAQNISPRLVASCDIFYNELMMFIESAMPIHDIDSAKLKMAVIESMLSNGDSINNTYFFKGLVHYRLKDYAAAAESFRRADNISPSSVFTLYALAMDRKQREKLNGGKKQ